MSFIIHLTEGQYRSLCQAKKLDHLLTPAERRVARIATLGYTIKEIADRLGNSPKTIGRHVESITNKARGVYGKRAFFRSLVVPELRCYYFVIDTQDSADSQI